MLDHFLRDRAAAQRLRANPIGSHLDGFTAWLSQRGYAWTTIRQHVWALGAFGRWLHRRGRSVRDLRQRDAHDFCRRRCAAHRRERDLAALRWFLEYLEAGHLIAATPLVIDRSPLAQLKHRYEAYLQCERALPPLTITRHWFVLRRFLVERFGHGPIDLHALRPDDVTRYLLRHVPAQSRFSTEVSTLRSFLRFLWHAGDIDRDLAAAIPPIRRCRLVDVPKYLPAAEVAHLLASVDRTSASASRVTTDLAWRWVTHFPNLSPVSVHTRFQIVRRFAEWRHVTDPLTEIPPIDLRPARYHRKPPWLYQDADIDRLLEAARHLPSPMGLRGLTFSALFGLLVVTGLRISEALALDDADVQRQDAQLLIRRSKFGKSRLVPLHASTLAALTAYAHRRDRVLPRRTTPAFFVSEHGMRLTVFVADYTFARISGQIGLRAPVHGHRFGHGPRLHDLRHRVAIRTLVDWYRAGLNIDPLLPLLATYLGHVHVHETYWYLEAVPELLALATERTPRPCRCEHDDDLHACAQSGSARSAKPRRSSVSARMEFQEGPGGYARAFAHNAARKGAVFPGNCCRRGAWKPSLQWRRS